MAEDQATFRTRVDTSLTEIKTTLRWHARIGWTAIVAAVVTVGGLLTWYLPKELSSYPTKLQVQELSGKLDALSTKVESLSGDLNKFMSLRIGGLIPNVEKAKKLTPEQLSASFHQANLLVDAALKSEVPADPELLIRSRTELRTVLNHVSLPAPVRHEGISTFGHLDAYAAFSQNTLGKIPIVKEAPPLPHQAGKALFTATIPLTLGQFSVVDPARQGIALVLVPSDFHGNVLVYEVRLIGLTQDLTKVKWLNVEFVNSTIKYNGGPLYLENVTFQSCKLNFGTDENSKKALAVILKAHGNPVTLISEFL